MGAGRPSAAERVRRSRQAARERIVAAATELVRQRSYATLSVEEVMREAGLGRTIFYRHFDDLADLILRAGREAIDELYEAERRLHEMQAQGGPLESIPQAIAIAVDTYHRHGPLLRAIAEASAGDDQLAARYHAIRERFDTLTREGLELTPRFAGPRAADAGEVALALNLMNEAYLLDAFGREPRVTPEVARRALTAIWSAVVGE